jgi:hypothetical protein
MRSLTHLERLEAESIHIFREVVAEAENPVMLYSVGKDSSVMLHLARKAFYPAPPPVPMPEEQSMRMEDSASEAARRERMRRGRSASILAGAEGGMMAPQGTARKTLLGG